MPTRFNSGDDNLKSKITRSEISKKKGLFSFVNLIAFFVFRKPILTLSIIVTAILIYVFLGGRGNSINNNPRLFGTGCDIDQQKYDKTMVFEPLASSSTKNKIPSSASLLKYAPIRKNQGQQGSCVGWASAYAARTIVESYSTGINPNNISFSPSFLYNQIALAGCKGSYTSEALEKMKNDGIVYFSKFPYNENSCSKKPTFDLLEEAKKYRIKGYYRISKGGNNYDVDIDAMKQNISAGAPVIIAMKVPESFYYVNTDLWTPESRDYKGIDKMSGHAMCVIGYDDNKFGGAVQVMNSWGRNWGNDGIFWMKYTDFSKFVREAYGLFPHSKSKNSSEDEFDVSFGLVHANNNAVIPVKQVKENLFKTLYPLKIGDRFKIEVLNNIDCYVYVFGQESDGSSYILFPYLEERQSVSKFSPYCGITGARHFPSGNAALIADNLGNKEYMAVVVSKKELDYVDLNDKINRFPGGDYLSKLNKAMGAMQITNPRFRLNASSVAFNAKSIGIQKAVGIVLEIDKK